MKDTLLTSVRTLLGAYQLDSETGGLNGPLFMSRAPSSLVTMQRLTHSIIQGVRAGEDRQGIIRGLVKLHNLLLSCWERRHQVKVVPDAEQHQFFAQWSQAGTDLVALIDQLIDTTPAPAVGAAAPKVELSSPGRAARKQQRQSGRLFTGDVFLADAPEIIERWNLERQALPNFGDLRENVTSSLCAILPQFAPYANSDTLASYGMDAEQLGTYMLLKQQLLLGISAATLAKNPGVEAELVAHGLASLSTVYQTPITLAHAKAIASPAHGYRFWWVMPASTLSILHDVAGVYPTDWSLP